MGFVGIALLGAALATPALAQQHVSDFTDRASQHRWGAGLLHPLPQGLNREQDPDTGAAGLEQLATPRKAGQRTLEARRPEAPL